ncbi:MAG: circadian clock protein KaiB [Candidatus Thiodiazotropha lotti]|uniref:Circadian clock protein KaiB n=1 Tax=Candidatus Thiodiazotropha lotti TaxID=2792787 RepID=A0A9E4K3Q7_9GAMM|nr:circadian clock protein KaiB [Candidatus Thiodiazotropha lotti]MCG7939087.1 circadian clock protein KaiB [Candidatus Thiodiazotropha lotti]MCG7987025.1 circadian clock protein KaiB [Candidatus Thiodiazotropha lotti]MCG8021295.1 circadian clock protein KaiB [Candidatus Thiodiazotropha lotti]MCW4203561.1 circadian clock protein KaiB [Candidatus Thiodiazotropha lotti]
MAKYTLRLYIIGNTPVTRRAIDNLKALCEEPEVAAHYDFEVINLIENPTLAEEERILATPVLIKKLPEPMRRIIGDLSDRERILVGLDLYVRGKDG